MKHTAQPWRHPETGVYHLRRQIPEALRPAFRGKTLWKETLKTKDFVRAVALFAQANAALEQRFEEARARLATTGDPRPSQRDRADELVVGYFEGAEGTEGGLDGSERLRLARIEVDAGLRNLTPNGCAVTSDASRWSALAENAAVFRDYWNHNPARLRRAPGTLWRECMDEVQKLAQAERVVEQILRYYTGQDSEIRPSLLDAVVHYLDRTPLEPTQARKPRSATSRLRPEMRMLELFDEWKQAVSPRPQTAHEFRGSIVDFIDFLGDVPANEVTNDDLCDYRDNAARLPKSLPRADQKLRFTERLARHRDSDAQRISPATLKKRVGAVQALLGYAAEQRWIKANAGKNVKITGYQKGGAGRQTYQEDQLQALLATPLFRIPESWNIHRSVSDVSLYWIILLCMTSGARLEEIGQARLSDVKVSSGLWYIDVDDYAPQRSDSDKSVKTETSRRLVPIHDHVIDLGFERYCGALRMVGATQVFPDLVPKQFGKRTKEVSRTVARYLDRHVSDDRRLVFHSLRHGYKDLATEAGLSDRVLDQICGHAPTTVGGKYGIGVRLKALHSFFHQLDWSFLDWQALAAAVRDVAWSEVVRRLAQREPANI